MSDAITEICLFVVLIVLLWEIRRLHRKVDHLHDHLILLDWEPDDDEPDEEREHEEPETVVAIGKRAA